MRISYWIKIYSCTFSTKLLSLISVLFLIFKKNKISGHTDWTKSTKIRAENQRNWGRWICSVTFDWRGVRLMNFNGTRQQGQEHHADSLCDLCHTGCLNDNYGSSPKKNDGCNGIMVLCMSRKWHFHSGSQRGDSTSTCRTERCPSHITVTVHLIPLLHGRFEGLWTARHWTPMHYWDATRRFSKALGWNAVLVEGAPLATFEALNSLWNTHSHLCAQSLDTTIRINFFFASTL